MVGVRRTSGAAICGLGIAVALACATLASAGQTQVETTEVDFIQPGTQPDSTGQVLLPIQSAQQCKFCHGDYLGDESFWEPSDAWVTSLMGQASRDPVWHAALAVANQDAAQSGEYCIRCHSPGAWLGGRSLPPDTSAFTSGFFTDDFDGVVCHFCHRSVNPVLEPDSPAEDVDILNDLTSPPGDGRGNGRYVVDPADVRRGPLPAPGSGEPNEVPQNLHGVPIIESAFHRRSEICATCHDLGNPVFELNEKTGEYEIGRLGVEHPTQDPHDMFPEQRTYSEWANSQFANGGVFLGDRFGGNHPTGVMEECQDCHMPKRVTGACAQVYAGKTPFFERPDVPQHSFVGSNHWLLGAMRSTVAAENPGTAWPDLFPDSDTGLSALGVDDQRARTVEMMRAASDTQLIQIGSTMKVRVINFSGHKLPTGYPEGRRVWINVKFMDEFDALIDERGAYDFVNATLDDSDTKVYKTTHEIDQAVADATGLPVGVENHLALNNFISFDNRIPPQGFTNAAYDAVGAGYVGYAYEDGVYWDDTEYTVPAGARSAIVTIYYQPMTREYAEFLRDNNDTNDWGQIVYDLWEDPLGGNMVPPIDMDMVMLDLSDAPAGDLDGDGEVGFIDLTTLLGRWGPCPPPDLCLGDLDCDGQIGFADLTTLLGNWG